ncbi:MAG: hypothetical protein HGB04_06490 [Chlorobiaceae bacterium]|nr:hypothetical protein [Chlorobiaceae bacterium]
MNVVHRILENPIGQYVGYGVVSGTSMIMLAAQDTAIRIDPLGVLSIIPSWAITVGWIISTIALTISTLAVAYKRIMEGKAAVMIEACTRDECPYRVHWQASRHKERQEEL